MTKLDSILKSRDIILSTKVHLVKAMFFPVVMYWCESWTIKKAEHWRIDAFALWWWRRLLRVPWAARRSNQSTLKEISPEYSLEGLMLKLKLQYVDHLMGRADSFVKILMLGKIEGRRRRDDRGWDGWIVLATQWTWIWVDLGVVDGQGGLACSVPGVAKSRTRLNDWTELNCVTGESKSHYQSQTIYSTVPWVRAARAGAWDVCTSFYQEDTSDFVLLLEQVGGKMLERLSSGLP